LRLGFFKRAVATSPYLHKVFLGVNAFLAPKRPKLHLFSRRYVFLKTPTLILLSKSLGSTCLILNTRYGFLTHTEAIKKNVGGILIFTVY